MTKSVEALVEGFRDGGCSYVTNFPGFKSHEIFFGLGGDRISINERVAFEMAYGASLAGKRTVVSFKGTGLNFTADAFLHTVINGINGGMVLVITDDIETVSSPERQDSRPYIDFFGGLWLEPTSLEQAYDFAYHSFEWSEKLDIPIVIRLSNQFFNLSGTFIRKSVQKSSKFLENRREKYISYWKQRQDNLNNKNLEIKKFVNTLYKETRGDETEGNIIFGNCQEEIATKNLKSYFQIYTYPIPENKVTSYLQNKLKVNVYEQGTQYGATKIKCLLSSIDITSNIGAYNDASRSWKIFSDQENLFMALKKISPSFVVGDEGTFTDESTKTIQMCLAMGTAIGVTAGLAANGVNYPWCINGDASFNMSGYQSITEAVVRKLKFGIIVFDNGISKSTGGQPIMGSIRNIPNVSKFESIYSENDIDGFTNVLKNMQNTNGISILYIKT